MSDAFEKRIKKHIIGKTHRFLAVSPLGFEQTLVRELEFIQRETRDERRENSQEGALLRSKTQNIDGSSAIGTANQPHVTGDGKVEFTAKITEAWKIVAYSRIANRVLMEVANFKAENFRELEKKAAEIPWELFLLDDNHLKRESHPTELGMPACKQSVATLASHVIASTKCEAIHHPIIEKILTSDISERAVSIIKHNIECSPLASVSPTPILPRHYDFFNYTANEIADACGEASPILVLNPPYGKRLHFDAPKLYTNIGKKIAELAHDLKSSNKRLTVAILVPKDDNREGSKYTCTANFLHECPAMSPKKNPAAKQIITSHGGFSLNVFIAVLDS